MGRGEEILSTSMFSSSKQEATTASADSPRSRTRTTSSTVSNNSTASIPPTVLPSVSVVLKEEPHSTLEFTNASHLLFARFL